MLLLRFEWLCYVSSMALMWVFAPVVNVCLSALTSRGVHLGTDQGSPAQPAQASCVTPAYVKKLSLFLINYPSIQQKRKKNSFPTKQLVQSSDSDKKCCRKLWDSFLSAPGLLHVLAVPAAGTRTW